MTTAKELSVISRKQLALRESLWPGIDDLLWHRSKNKGYATIPKTMLILKIMDEMTKGAPVSSTYLTLWCSTWDNSFVSLAKPAELAHAAGFSGQRAEHTWTSRMRKLQELGFIDIKAGKSGAMSYAVILNPHLMIRKHYKNKTPGLTEASYTALIDWALEIGAKDMTEPMSAGAAAPAA
jgi:hypothetical protein